MEFCEHLPQVLNCLQTTGHAAIRNEADRLGVPFRAVLVDRGLEDGGETVVVLRCHDDEGSSPRQAIRELRGVARSLKSTSNWSIATLRPLMEQAVDACVAHVEAGGLPFVGVLVDDRGTTLTEPGVNRVLQTGDPTAHAEVVTMREAMTTGHLESLQGAVLLATGEPCGLCYRYAIEHKVKAIYVAVDRDEVAAFGFDHRSSYAAFGITDADRDGLFQPLRVRQGAAPFTRYLHTTSTGPAPTRPGTNSKGTPS